jgi:hypothetical protein
MSHKGCLYPQTCTKDGGDEKCCKQANKLREMMNLYCCVCITVCLFVGVPTWLVGCNPRIAGGCLTRDIVNTTLVSKEPVGNQCCASTRVCPPGGDKSDCKTQCTGGYTCWTCRYHFEDGGAHCTMMCGTTYKTEPEVASDTSGYQINQSVMLAYDPNTHLCATPGNAFATWVVGIIFMSFMACGCCVWGGVHIYLDCSDRRRREAQKVSPSPLDGTTSGANPNNNNNFP